MNRKMKFDTSRASHVSNAQTHDAVGSYRDRGCQHKARERGDRGPRDDQRHHPSRRCRRVPARRELVRLGQHRPGGAGRTDVAAPGRRFPEQREDLPGRRRRQHGQRRLQRPRDPRQPEGEHRVLLPRRWRWRLVRDVRVQDPQVRRQLRLPVLRRPADRLVGQRAQRPGGLGGHPEGRPRREPGRRASGLRR